MIAAGDEGPESVHCLAAIIPRCRL